MYWNYESWGNETPPENWEEICSRANSIIDHYSQTHTETETDDFSERLWNEYCENGKI